MLLQHRWCHTQLARINGGIHHYIAHIAACLFKWDQGHPYIERELAISFAQPLVHAGGTRIIGSGGQNTIVAKSLQKIAVVPRAYRQVHRGFVQLFLADIGQAMFT